MKTKVSISRKITLIFIATFIIEILLFVILISFALRNIKRESTYAMLESRLNYMRATADTLGTEAASKIRYQDDNVACALYYYKDKAGEHVVVEEQFYKYIDPFSIANFVNEVRNAEEEKGSFETETEVIYYLVSFLEDGSIIVLASAGNSLNSYLMSNLVYIIAIFAAIFIVGAFVVVISIRSTVHRINLICSFVQEMPQNNYRNSYIDNGDDEIEILSRNIDDMRLTITQDEKNRDLMLQNISHDLKTPIAVIKSYAEAIFDKVEPAEKAEIIIKQAEKLENKVKNLIEFNKLAHLKEIGQFEQVVMKDIIDDVVYNCKHIASDEINFDIDLDDTVFIGKAENYYTVVENIVENAIRYAKHLIKISLKNGVLKISNDGEPISNDFIEKGFRPYEKGHQGQFGLGMSIVARTLQYFNMELEVVNEEQGVSFIIYAKDGE